MTAPYAITPLPCLPPLPPEQIAAVDESDLMEQDSGQGSAATSFVVEWQLT